MSWLKYYAQFDELPTREVIQVVAAVQEYAMTRADAPATVRMFLADRFFDYQRRVTSPFQKFPTHEKLLQAFRKARHWLDVCMLVLDAEHKCANFRLDVFDGESAEALIRKIDNVVVGVLQIVSDCFRQLPFMEFIYERDFQYCYAQVYGYNEHEPDAGHGPVEPRWPWDHVRNVLHSVPSMETAPYAVEIQEGEVAEDSKRTPGLVEPLSPLLPDLSDTRLFFRGDGR